MQTKFVKLAKFAEMTGYTKRAVYQKMYDGVWAEGVQFRRAPDGNILVNIEGYERWVEAGKAAASASSRKASKSDSHGTESDAPKT